MHILVFVCLFEAISHYIALNVLKLTATCQFYLLTAEDTSVHHHAWLLIMIFYLAVNQ